MGNDFSKGESERGRIRRGNEGSTLILTRLIFKCPATMYPQMTLLVNVLTLPCARNHTDLKWLIM